MVAGSRSVHGVRGCTEMNFYLRKKRKHTKASHSLTPSSSLGDHFPSGETGWETGTRNRIQSCPEVGLGSRWLARCWTGAPQGKCRPLATSHLDPHPWKGTAAVRFWPGPVPKHPWQPRARTARRDARSPREGGCARSRVREGEAARGAPGPARRVLPLGSLLVLVSEFSNSDNKLL